MTSGNERTPWFGPKRVGWGYRPQTWQGWSVLAILIAASLITGALAPLTAWFWVMLILVVTVPLAIMAIQRR